jgi:chromosome segregation ATPase
MLPTVPVSVGPLLFHLPLHMDALSTAAFARAKAEAEAAFAGAANVRGELEEAVKLERSVQDHLADLRAEGGGIEARIRGVEGDNGGRREALSVMRQDLVSLQQQTIEAERAQTALRGRIADIQAVSEGRWTLAGFWIWE